MTEPVVDPPATSFLDSLGPRGRRRAEPRASIAIAGAGCALGVLGVMIVAGDTGASDGDFNRAPGILLSALVVAAGFFVLTAVREGPLATAGAAAAALGVPPLVFFLTYSQNDFPPYSTDAILIVSTVTWLAAYAIGPGRGRPFFLGAGLIGLWFTLLQLTEQVFETPFGMMGMFGGGFESTTYDYSGPGMDGSGMDGSGMELFGGTGMDGPMFDMPDPTTLGLLSIALGIAFLVMCRWLDTRGHHGAATPFAFATLPTLYTGATFLVDDLEQAGTGLLVMVLGGALAWHGASLGRRITTWTGGAAGAIGAAVFLGDMTDDATVGGMLFIAAGIGLVAAGHAVATALGEADEMTVTVGPGAVAVTTVPAPPSAPPPVDHTSQWAPPPSDPPPPPTPPPPPS
ncbi:MAG: hypothetical protein ACT4OV_03050 [Microthrixaceae bacterium]